MPSYVDTETLISALNDALSRRQNYNWTTYFIIKEVLNTIPTVDAVKVVRCKDCRFYSISRLACNHPYFNGWINVDGFCSYGERKE